MLAAGSALGPYKIIAALGAGGMGQVYRVHDTRLGRDVALKVIQADLARDPESVRRFEQEARAAGALTHPNVCAIHDVGTHAGAPFVVMELLEGETLRAKLAAGPVPVRKALEWGAQVARGLAAAHEKGIVHRDLKPENVFVTRDGRAKVLDFGLAKLTRPLVPGATGEGAGPDATQTGAILGTVGYMAPEQARGQPADKRSDLFALGAILYELLSGRRAFHGATLVETLNMILKEDPERLSASGREIPLGVEALVLRCLEKESDQRFQSASDLAFALESAQGSDSGLRAAALGRARDRRRRERAAWIAALAVATSVGAVALVLLASRTSEPVQLELAPPSGANLLARWSSGVISPDGRRVAFQAQDSTGTNHIWIRELDSARATMLSGTETSFGYALGWSPDSRFVCYFDAKEEKLAKIPEAGGVSMALADGVDPRGVAWGRRGVILLAPKAQGPICRIPESGGIPVPVTTLDTTRHEVGHRFPCFLPDDDHFLYAGTPGNPRGYDIYVGSLASGRSKWLMTAQSAATYAEPGYLIYVRDGKVVAQRFDRARLALRGNPEILGGEVLPYPGVQADQVASASRNGRLLLPGWHVLNTELRWLGRDGAPRGTVALPRGPWEQPALSPDARLAIVKSGRNLWQVDFGHPMPTLVAGGGLGGGGLGAAYPVVSPDGRDVAFLYDAGSYEIRVVSIDGSGSRVLRTTPVPTKYPWSWTSDGRSVVFADFNVSTRWDILVEPVYGDGHVASLLHEPYSENGGWVSPDGRWIAYRSDESGRFEIYVQSFPTPGSKVRVSTEGGMQAWWTANATELVYLDERRRPNVLMSVALRREGSALRAAEPKVLCELPPDNTGVDVARDGQRILVCAPAPESDRRTLRVILNWPGLLKGR